MSQCTSALRCVLIKSKHSVGKGGAAACEAMQERSVDDLDSEQKQFLQVFDHNSAKSARKSMQRILGAGVHLCDARARELEALRTQVIEVMSRPTPATSRGWPPAEATASNDRFPMLLLNFTSEQVCFGMLRSPEHQRTSVHWLAAFSHQRFE
jgi:hypothetical protein